MVTLSEAQVWLFLFSGVVGVLVTAVTSIMAARNSANANIHAKAAAETVGAVGEKVDTIEVNTNSRVSKQDDMIRTLSDQVAALTKQIADMEQTRALLAAEKKEDQK